MKNIILFTGLLLVFVSAQAQSPVGKWKLTNVITETVAGKKTDHVKDLSKTDPCMAKAALLFTADGKITETGNTCPEAKKNFPGEIGTGWTVSGNKITIGSDDKDIDPVTYTVEYKGKNMIWTIIYGDDPDISNTEEVKSITMVFEKV